MSFYEKYQVTKTVLSNICYNKLIGSIDFNNKTIKYYKGTKILPFLIYTPYIFFNDKTFIYYKYNKYSLNKENICISPIINKIEISYDGSEYIEYENIIKKYSYSFPLWVILELEKLKDIKSLRFEKKKILNTETIYVDIKEYLDKTLHQIFNLKK
jgi:hypothetical protein